MSPDTNSPPYMPNNKHAQRQRDSDDDIIPPTLRDTEDLIPELVCVNIEEYHAEDGGDECSRKKEHCNCCDGDHRGAILLCVPCYSRSGLRYGKVDIIVCLGG
jgi:hypothetical protein